MTRYAELQCASHFSFLKGASSCEELFAQAALYGIEALAITDRNSLAGIVRAHNAAKVTGVRLIVGCQLELQDGSIVLVYPTDKPAYSRLCRMLSVGKARAGKGECCLTWDDLQEYGQGMIALLVPEDHDAACVRQMRQLANIFNKDAFVALTLRRRPGDAMRLYKLGQIAAKLGVGTVITNNVLFHMPNRRMLQDVMTCIRHGCTIDELGFRRNLSADRHLLLPEEMARRYRDYPKSLANAIRIAERCRFSLDELTYQYPKEIAEPGKTPQETLESLTWEGAKWRYPEGVPDKVMLTLQHELKLIQNMDYAPYFLTVHSIVRFARSQDILCQGRGSAANSAVCFVLGITSIDPERNDLLFERFVSQERNEPPDIDVDFEHERREIVMQWIFDTYGRHRAALCSTVIRYRAKGAMRDVGKALGLPEDLIKSLSSLVWGWSREGVDMSHVKELNLNLDDRRLKLALELASLLIGTPRHLSQHPGGFVLTHDRLDDLVPIEPATMENRQVVEWDKDDIDVLKFMKVDVLALGMLTCMKRGLNMLKDYKGIEYDLASIPAEDPRTYAMIRKADTLGTFQIESRAQMSMLPRLKPRTFYDLVIQVAIVRPGPIQGDMVHPYLKRREGKEAVDYPKPELERILKKTLGVPLFQEQAMKIAIDCGGFTPGEADELRRAMATFKFEGNVSKFHEKLITGMMERGYTKEFAERIFKQLEGFGSYGFPESHAASFAIMAYSSSWLKCHHPDIFCAALLNSQPMGFYEPAQIVRDAREHGVEIRPVCVNYSRWDCTLEEKLDGSFAVRLGLRMVKGLNNQAAALLVASREEKPFTGVEELWHRAGVPVAQLVNLAEGDAFLPSLKLSRREALWQIKALRDTPLPLFAAADHKADELLPEIIEPIVTLKAMKAGHEVTEDYGHVGLTLRNHPVSFIRDKLIAKKYHTCLAAVSARDGYQLRTAGLVLVRQKPGSAKGTMFITIEDETSFCNLVVWQSLFEKYRRIILGSGMIGVQAKVQREGEVTHLVVRQIFDLSEELSTVANQDTDAALPKARDIYIPDLHLDTIKVKTRDFK